MPVAVVALAAGSFAAGATAFAAATTVAGMVAAGATMVGSALTAVGTVTGNQNLTKIGAVVGIAGGLGSLAVGADAAAAGAGAADAATSAGTDAAASGAGAGGGIGASDALGSAIQTSPVDLGGTSVAGASGSAASPGASGLDSSVGSSAATNAAVNPATAGLSASSTGATPGMLDSTASNAAAQAVSGSSNDLLAQALSNPTSTMDASQTAIGQSVGNALNTGSTSVGQSLNMNPFNAGATASSTDTGMLGSMESYPGAIDAAANAPAGISTPIGVNPASNTSSANQFGGSSGSGVGATMDQLQAWAKQNPTLAQAALSGTGTLLQNLVPSAKDKAMMQQYAAQTALANQQTSLLKTRLLWGSGRLS